MDNRGRNINSPRVPVSKKVPPRTQGKGQAPKKDPRGIYLYAAIGAVILILVACAVVNMIIGVRTVEVVGSDLSTREEIISIAGIKEGSGYFSYNTRKSENKVLENIPCVEEINITRSIFGKVKITVVEKKAFWYVQIFNEYYALADDLEVIRRSEDFKEFCDRGLVRIDFPKIESFILGLPLEFSDEDRDCSFIWDFLSEIKDSQLYQERRLYQICIKNKFEIFIVSDLKYEINIGKYSSAKLKLDTVREVLSSEKLNDGNKWEITVMDDLKVVPRIENDLDFSHLAP